MATSFLIVDKTNKKLYSNASGSWQEFPVQPGYGGLGITVGYPVVGGTDGSIICYDSTVGAQFKHYDPSAGSWSTKARASAGSFLLGSGCFVDATHVYVWGGGYVEKFNGSVWSDMTAGGALTNGCDHGWAAGVDDLWVCNGQVNLWHYTTAAGWVDVKASLPTFNTFTISQVKDVWAYSPTSVYILGYINAYDRAFLIRYNGSTYTILTGNYFTPSTNSPVHNVWGISDNAVWISGNITGQRNIWFWNGTSFAATRLITNTGGSGSLLAGGRALIGYDATHVVSCSYLGAGYLPPNTVFSTVDGTTWAADTFPHNDSEHTLGLYYAEDPSTPRAGDTLYYNATYLFGPVTGAIRFRFRAPTFTPTRNHYLVGTSDGGAATDRIHAFIDTSGRVCVESAKSAGAAGSVVITGNRCDGAIHDVLVTWQPNDLRICADDVWGTPDTTCDIPAGLDRLEVGQNHAAANQAGPIIVGEVKTSPRFWPSFWLQGGGFRTLT